jgi:hypothetical protein
MRHKLFNPFPILAVALLSTGCAIGPPTQQEMNVAVRKIGRGSPLTEDYRADIKRWFFTTLKDPMSAQYVFSTPVIGAARVGGQVLPGYLVSVQVNSKDSSGAYVGFKTYSFVFRNNQLIGVYHTY